MHIPKRFEKKLAQDRSLRRSVDDAIAEFEPWLRESKLPFFPDYTNHGAEHVEGVLVTASSLISDDAWAVLTAADATVLILAALLHDCAMHLTEEGFRALVSGSTHAERVEGFGDVAWPELWQEFLFSAKRFDDRALTDLFGRPVAVRTPPADKDEMTPHDRLLIGEFVRRHHPRLAHEIAVRGVPGPTRNPISLSERLAPEFADLAGLVARSHGLPLRATFDYLNEHYHRLEYNNVHAVFLMAVLRVADYLQIQAERAPRQMLQVKEIRSPVSRGEWRAHHSVKNVVTLDEDPEAILIQAAPPDVRTYLRLKDWLGGIQAELDSSWAVLGEVYGRVEELRRLGLVIRRVRSNLDDERAFSRRVDYVPRRVEFDIARSEILKLLVRPLYGDKPEVGIRELLQNSLDAVRELWDLQEQNPSLKDADLIEQEADIVMWLDEPDETGRATFTISDRGVGMTEEVVTDYFLKVGASYRHSDAWARQHERPDEETDAGEDNTTPKSRVLRSGRFGIGALAAFLLGDEIEVSTRHLTAPKGIRFTTRLDSEPVELRYDDTLKVGTTVRTYLTGARFEQLTRVEGLIGEMNEEQLEGLRSRQDNWDWYCLKRPSVLRLLGRQRVKLSQRLTLPTVEEALPPGWYEVSLPGYQAVYCTLRHDYGFACNGIEIKDADGGNYNPTHDFYWNRIVKINNPLVSLFDPDGNLPLDLTRSSLTGVEDLSDGLIEAQTRYFLAYLIVHTPTDLRSLRIPHTDLSNQPMRRGLMRPKWPLWPWFYTAAGMSISEYWNIRYAGVNAAVLLDSENWPSKFISAASTTHDAIFLMEKIFAANTLQPILETLIMRAREILNGAFLHNTSLYAKVLAPKCRLITNKKFGSLLLTSLEKFNALSDISVEWTDDKLMSLTSSTPPPSRLDVNLLGDVSSLGRPYPFLAEWFLGSTNRTRIENMQTRLSLAWEQLIREPVIPYDPEERRRKLAHAYEVLAPYIEKIEADARAVAAIPPARPRRGRRKKV